MAHWGIRNAVHLRVRPLQPRQLSQLIEDTRRNQLEEKNLPGLGVLLELMWQGSTESERNHMVQVLHQELQKEPAQATQATHQ